MAMLSLPVPERSHGGWLLLLFAAFVVLMPLLLNQVALTTGGARDLLEQSFAQQRPVIHGKEMPASSLRVRYRWRATGSGGRGGVVEMDANWLCQTEDGLFVVAIGQVWTEMDRLVPSTPPQIRWIWRSITEERAKQLLTATPDAYREVFGADPGTPASAERAQNQHHLADTEKDSLK